MVPGGHGFGGSGVGFGVGFGCRFRGAHVTHVGVQRFWRGFLHGFWYGIGQINSGRLPGLKLDVG